jgi:hypothetical protein
MPVSGSVFAASVWFAMFARVCEEKERAEKEKKSAGLNYALQPLGKFRGHEILGL